MRYSRMAEYGALYRAAMAATQNPTPPPRAQQPEPARPAQTATQPWAATGEHPVDWALRTGRITAKSAAWWQDRYDEDPSGIGNALASLYPVLDGRLDRLEAQAEAREARVEDDEFAEFDALFPPHQRSSAYPAARATTDPVDDDEFAHLYPPGWKPAAPVEDLPWVPPEDLEPIEEQYY